MNSNKAKIFVFSLFLALLSSGVHAATVTVEGTIQGLSCIIHGKLCPVDKNDPRIAAERLFVVYSGKNDYKVVDNISSNTLSYYLGRKVRVSGDINKKYNAIEAHSLEVMKKGKFNTVWTLKAQLEEKKHWFRGGGGGR